MSADIESARARIRELQPLLADARAEGLSRAETAAVVASQIATWREQGAAEIAGQVRLISPRGHAIDLLHVDLPFGENKHVEALDTLALGPLLTVMLGEKAVGRIFDAFLQDVPEGSSTADRRARIADLERELREMEKLEARLMFDAEDDGRPIDPRGDQDPRYLLVEGFAK